MEPVEFLDGKYCQAEQILPGPIQTFRAQETAAARPVFVHRVSVTGEPAQHLALLELLSAALLRSPKARKMVLDVADHDGFYYVVTQTAPQCLLVREWLQCEVDDPTADNEASPKQTSFVLPGEIRSTPAEPVNASPPR